MCLDAVGSGALPPLGLDGYKDARAIVRLVQCFLCSFPLRTPVTLPCGNCCCKECLPPSHQRAYITFPATAGRHYALTCPFAECEQDHTIEDCSVNVVLLNIMEALNGQLSESQRDSAQSYKISMDEIIQLPPASEVPIVDESALEKGHSHTAPGARLLATFSFAASGLLHYTSDVSYSVVDEGYVEETSKDAALLEVLKSVIYNYVECHVCYNLMYDPATTPCGHTFCRKCLRRMLDHSPLCPVCRRSLFLPSSLSDQPSNKFLLNLMESLWPDQVAARAEAVAVEERSAPEGLDTPLFVCTLSFPGLRTYLHIFEPRYRLMIRRAVESNGQFGMIPYNRYLEPQGRLGRTQFMECGTLLQIERYQMLPDGRSFIECRGTGRFKVRAHGMMDGYVVANVQKVEDIALADEERIEAEETSATPVLMSSDVGAQIERLPTSDLFHICVGFVARAREQSARWFSNRLLETYGEPPNDPSSLPYWLAAVLPLLEEEKYKVIPSTSIRERLKITARWVHRIESQRW